MANLNYHYRKALYYCKKQVNENPYIAKALLIHVSIVVLLYVLLYVSTLRFNSDMKLELQINKSKKMQVIQATSISNTDLNKQIWTYEDNHREKRQAQKDVKQAREDLKKARIKAIQKAKERTKARVEDQGKAKLKEQKKADTERERKIKLDTRKKLEEKKKLAEEQKHKSQQDAEKKALDNRLAKAKAEDAARKQVEQSQAQAAISGYISQYQERVGSNWIKDSCRGIYKFPEAITRNGQFIKLTGTSGNYKCDQSLIDAVKNTQPPAISNNVARQTVQSENLRFNFNSN